MATHKWDTIIKPKSDLINLNFSELWRYRDLIQLFIKRDFVAYYKQTILGPLWYIIQPLLTTVVFTLIFGKFAKIPTDGVPPFLFYLSGNILWGYFSISLTNTSNTFITNSKIFSKVYFPRLTVPISVVIVNFAQFAIQFLLFISFLIFYYLKGAAIKPNYGLVLLPLIMIQMALLTFGVGVIISSLTTKYRDLRFSLSFIIQVWMFLSPIVYPLSQIPEDYRMIYICNPMVSVIEGFRMITIGVGSIQSHEIVIGQAITLFSVIFGVFLFSRIEKTFIDTV